ncbi:MAG: nucleotidyltransferase family protein [Gemmataceae bacterium]|nr:nucleotidyltransferase family protein [Gemmataceae bacterium]
MLTYEQKLDRDISWALLEGSMHFEKESAVHKALRAITKRLDELDIPYAVVGAMALFFHGYRRFTEDVDLLVDKQSLQEVHRQLEGLGYLPPFTGSKQLRDVEHGVRVEFLVAGEYPGDGKPKPIAFPDPQEVVSVVDGIRVINLKNLIELKLASGMTNPKRAKDLVDVQELIEVLELPEDYANELHPYVQAKFKELWQIVHSNP